MPLEVWQGPRAVSEITSSALTKAFLNCNELPKSELCAVQVPSSPQRTPSYKTPPYTRIYSGIPVAASATPRHEYIYIDRPSRHFSFGSSLCRSRSVSIPSILYLYRRDVSVFLRAELTRARASPCSFHRELAYER